MRLGVVMTGIGAHAAACSGVLRALEERGIEPVCVCGIDGGAWPAAFFAMGKDAKESREILCRMEKTAARLLRPTAGAHAVLEGRKPALCDGKRIEKLLLLQAGHRVLSLCERPAAFPCRLVRNGRHIVFSTRPLEMDGAVLAMQASVSFAARAAMALPPLIAPLEYMGSQLLGERDVSFSCQLLYQMGAQRVLLVVPEVSERRKPDALDLAALDRQSGAIQAAQEAQAGLVRVPMPETAAAGEIHRARVCELAGYLCARERLDAVLEGMGMANCRILPFERRPMALKL